MPFVQEERSPIAWSFQNGRTTTVNNVDFSQMKEEMKRDIFNQVFRDVHGIEREGSRQTSYLFSEEIMAAPFPFNFKILNIATYNGRGISLTTSMD